MTADDARAMTRRHPSSLTDDAHILLLRWHTAIQKAADKGRRSVDESQVEPLDGETADDVRKAALNQLSREGFIVIQIKGQGSTSAQVSW